MGKVHTINETLVSNLALLAAGSCCVASGVGITAFGIFAAPALGIGGWGLKKWSDRLKDKDPNNEKAIRKIQDRINESLTGDARFADIAPETLGRVDIELTEAVAKYWPAPKMIVDLTKETGGFPAAIAAHILDEINGSAFASGLFEEGAVRTYAEAVIMTALEAGLEDKAYFETLKPHVMMKNLDLTGQIQRDVESFVGKLDSLQYFLGETLERVEGKVDVMDAKVDEILLAVRGNNTFTREEDRTARETIAEMLSSERQASMDAVKELMAEPPNPQAATNRLRQAIAEQDDAEEEARRNKLVLLKEVATINYFSNGAEAVLAYQEVVNIDPNDADTWNQLGTLNCRLGNLNDAVSAFEELESIGMRLNGKGFRAVAYGNLGNVAKTRGDWDGAVIYYEKSLALNKELGDIEGIARNYGNLGNVTRSRGDLDGAVTYHEKSLALNEELGCKEGMGNAYGNLGIVAEIHEDLDGAVIYYKKSLALNEELGSKGGMAHNYGNLGNVARRREDLDRAVAYYEKSLALNEELSHKEGMARNYGNLGTVAMGREDLDCAVTYHEKSLALNEELGRKEGMARNYGNLGSVAAMLEDLDGAITYWNKALSLFTEIGAARHMAIVKGWINNLKRDS